VQGKIGDERLKGRRKEVGEEEEKEKTSKGLLFVISTEIIGTP